MKLGFEVAADDADLMIDNVKLRPASNNIVFNGDFSLGDSAWVFEGADVSVTDGELVFGNIPGLEIHGKCKHTNSLPLEQMALIIKIRSTWDISSFI